MVKNVGNDPFGQMVVSLALLAIGGTVGMVVGFIIGRIW